MPLSRFDNGKRVAGMSDGLPVDVALEDRDVYAFLHFFLLSCVYRTQYTVISLSENNRIIAVEIK